MPYLGKCDTCTCVRMVVVVIQWLTCVWPFVTPWIIARQAPLSSTISRSLLRFMTIELVMPSNQLILCCPLLLLPSIFPSIRVFSNSQLFALGGQSVGASTSIFPMSIQGWFPLGLTGLNSLQSKGLLSRAFSSTAVRGHQFFCTQPSLWSNSHICTWILEKPYRDCHRNIYIYIHHKFPMLELKNLDNYSTRLLTDFVFLYFILLSFLAFYHSVDFVLRSILYTTYCSACWQDPQGLTLIVKVKVAQPCLTLCNPMDYIVHGIL